MRRLDTLRRFYDNPDPWIRAYALSGLDELDDDFERSEIIEFLGHALADEAHEVRCQARRSLERARKAQLADRYRGRKPATLSVPGTWTGYSMERANVRVLSRLQAVGSIDLSNVDFHRLVREALDLLEPAVTRAAHLAATTDEEQRAAAISVLGRFDYPVCVETLGRLAARPESAVRAARGLAELGTSEALSALLTGIDKVRGSEGYREMVVELGAFVQPEALRQLLDIDRSGDEALRIRVALALRHVRHPEAERILLQMVEAGESHVMLFAMAALAHVGSQRAVAAITQVLERATTPLLRAEALRALGNLGVPVSHEPVLDALGDSSPWVRAEAVETLVSLGVTGSELVDAFIPAREDQAPHVQANAALALVPMDPSAALRIVASLLKRSDSASRACGAYCLGYLHGDMALHTLEQVIETSTCEAVSVQAVKALAKYPSIEAFPILMRSIHHPYVAVRHTAARILATSRFEAIPSSVGRVVKAISQEEDSDIQCALAAALATLASPSQSIVIRTLLAEASPQLQATVVETLDLLGSIDMLPVIEPFLGSDNPSVRAQAALALWHGGELSVVDRLERDLVSEKRSDVIGALAALAKIGSFLELFPGSGAYPLLVSQLAGRCGIPLRTVDRAGDLAGAAALPREGGPPRTGAFEFAPAVVNGDLGLSPTLTEADRLIGPPRSAASGNDGVAVAVEGVLRSIERDGPAESLAFAQELADKTGNPWARYALAEAYCALNQKQEAVAELRRVVNGVGDVVVVRLALAMLLRDLGSENEAAEHLAAATRRALELGRRELELQLADLRDGPPEACATCLDALSTDRSLLRDAHRRFGKVLMNCRSWHEAFEHLYWAHVASPGDLSLTNELKSVSERTGRQGLVRALDARCRQREETAQASQG